MRATSVHGCSSGPLNNWELKIVGAVYEGEDSAALRMERAKMGEEAKEEGPPSTWLHLSHVGLLEFEANRAVNILMLISDKPINLIPEVVKAVICSTRRPTQTLLKARMT
ncbi:uncharacterized protein ARMOST_20872 [Armillaria ostoyae]|uniref:Uncharacterized protein n=1 Tax=Armillaria ostoyae TaxID=47428 RepID=A0A284S8J2_ARMOS|nr:uncharacterized protein ARMOST_20872 [Armillaria ostoyae]